MEVESPNINPKVQDENEDENNLPKQVISTKDENTAVNETGPAQKTKRGKGKSKISKKLPAKGLFKCTNSLKEDHGQPLFGVSFCHQTSKDEYPMFASVGSNRIAVYECRDDGYIKLLQAYSDPESEENFYSCTWTVDSTSGHPLLAVAGSRGIIRVLNVSTKQCIKHYIGHGNAVNELKFHPQMPQILLSASKDHSLRVWNIKTDVLVCMFSGVEGHRDEVLSCDFNIFGTKIISCGMDHSLKIWNFDGEDLKSALKASEVYKPNTNDKPFPTLHFHNPYFSTRDIHKNYVDCARWFGDFILSKSCENCIVCWKPGSINCSLNQLKPKESNVTVLSRLEFQHCDIWYMRFAIDYWHKYLAVGNQYGKTFIWELDHLDPAKSKCFTLSNIRCTTTIRQTAFSKDGSILICVCDDSTIWRWDLQGK
uniref:Polycomb protein eed n=1 Tax=Ciona intestinalis TaxID=7719 RepID=F6UZU2_CIOIN|nr:polycomb protein eed [Ciona intestinalis]|eukprot:XP_002128612.1 polycomb protein eed [Ciona intestinalis]